MPKYPPEVLDSFFDGLKNNFALAGSVKEQEALWLVYLDRIGRFIRRYYVNLNFPAYLCYPSKNKAFNYTFLRLIL